MSGKETITNGNENQKYFASKNYILREITGLPVLVSVGAGVADFCGVITLNSSAAVLWRCLESGCTKSEAIDVLMTQFSVERERACADVDSVFKLLQDRKMVYDG